jgi:hypothetical protein
MRELVEEELIAKANQVILEALAQARAFAPLRVVGSRERAWRDHPWSSREAGHVARDGK